MKPREIYKFDRARDILVHVFHDKQRRNASFSIRAWSRRLGFQNPSYLSEILSGKRNITNKFVPRIAPSLGISREEKAYFEALVFHDNSKTEAEKEFFQLIIKKLREEESPLHIKPDKYDLVKDWYYGVLDEMTCLSDFRPDAFFLSRRLRDVVSAQAIEMALKDLERLGSLERSPTGRLRRPRKVFFTPAENPNDLEDPFLRKYQKQYLDKAIVAIDEQKKSESLFRMTNIPIRSRDVKAFQEAIEDFIRKAGAMESPKDADDVYQLSVQFFKLTKPATGK